MNAASAATGSVVLRQAQEWEFAAGIPCDRVWCIGHMPPSEWSHVHSTPVPSADIVQQIAVGAETNRHRWNISQAPAIRASCDRVQRMFRQDSTRKRRVPGPKEIAAAGPI
jgi:hypothetical protein